VEKYLKGVLIHLGIAEPPRVHNLDALCLMCIEMDGRFCELAEACSALTRYAVQPRYPSEMEILESDMTKAVKHAQFVRDFEPLANIRREVQERR